MICHPIPFHVNDSEKTATVFLSYQPKDPLAACMRFPLGITWEFSLDLLIEGLTAKWETPSGVGDVIIWRHSEHQLCIEFQGKATVVCDWWRVAAFVAEVQMRHPDRDQAIADALDGWLARQEATQ